MQARAAASQEVQPVARPDPKVSLSDTLKQASTTTLAGNILSMAPSKQPCSACTKSGSVDCR